MDRGAEAEESDDIQAVLSCASGGAGGLLAAGVMLPDDSLDGLAELAGDGCPAQAPVAGREDPFPRQADLGWPFL